jgi:hypothetical protein
MVFSNGERLLVVGASDLAAAIMTDEDGNRVFENVQGHPSPTTDTPKR